MSASNGLNAARRRRAGAAPAPPSGPVGRRPTQVANKGDNVETSPTNPHTLLLQHDRRLFEIEKQVPAALRTINANIEVLKEGYNSLTRSDGSAPITSYSGAGAPAGQPAMEGLVEVPEGLSDEIAVLDTKINTALTEALTSKTMATATGNKMEQFKINEFRELSAAHEELKIAHDEVKRDLAELRSIVDELRGKIASDNVTEVSLNVTEE